MIYNTKMITFCDTKTFATIAPVVTERVLEKVEYTHEMKFEFSVNQRL